MTFIADILLVAGALGAGLYCHVLSRRLRRFADLEKGVGGAVAMLSTQVEDLSRSVSAAQATARGSVETLSDVSARAEAAARQLELLVASLHDISGDQVVSAPANPFFARKGPSLEARQ